jgi:uncharacterized protein (TIGR01244 family)
MTTDERPALGRRALALALVALLLSAAACATSGDSDEPAETSEPAAAAEPAAVEARPVAAPIEIPNARLALDGVLTGGQPTPEQIAEAAAAGYRTIVNTRSSAEDGYEWEEEQVTAAGMRYLLIDTPGAAGLTRENVQALADVMADDEAYPMMIHCASGNRVGALLALKAVWIDGASADEAMQVGLDSGLTRLEAKTRELLTE